MRSRPTTDGRLKCAVLPLCAAAALCGAMPAFAQSPVIHEASARQVRLEPGGRAATLVLHGVDLDLVKAARVVRDGKPVMRGVDAGIASRSADRLTLTLSAIAGAAAGGGYRVELAAGRHVVTAPVEIEVAGRPLRDAPDLVISSVRVLVLPDGRTTYMEGVPIDTKSAVLVEVFARNIGSAPAEFPPNGLRWRVEKGLRTMPSATFVGNGCHLSVAPGQECSASTVIASRGALAEGRYTLVLKVDSDDAVAESNEANNEYRLDIEVVRHRPEPAIETYWIANPRPGTSGNVAREGIVDPDLVSPVNDPSDGVFWIRGQALDAPGLRVMVGEREATILERSRSGGSDVVKARIRDFRPGPLSVLDTTRAYSRNYLSGQVRRLGYRALSFGELTSLAGNVRCSVGSPRGRASITMPNGTSRFTVPPYEGLGFRVDIVDLNSNSVVLRARPGGRAGSEFIVEVDIGFETSGHEFEGRFLPTVSWWECGTFRVETARCANLDLACFADVVGTALASSLSCLNPANWRQATGPGPAIPFTGDLTSPRAVFRTTVGVQGNRLVARELDASFTAGITLRSGVGDVPLDPLRGMILDRASDTLREAAAAAGLDTQIVQVLNGLIGSVEELRWLEPIQGNRLYLEFAK